MENILIIAIVLMIAAAAMTRVVRRSRGGCCGSGSNTIRDKKALSAPELGRKILHIEGMKCENCEIRISNALNRLEHVACTVSRKKKTAVAAYSAEVSEELLKATVEKLGYKVTAIENA